jgi:hypothetical protein
MAYLMTNRTVPAGSTISVSSSALGVTLDTIKQGSFIVLLLLGGGFALLVNAAYKEKEEGLRAARLARNPRGKGYYVRIKGERAVYGPYTLKSAKDFARIGSQFGKTRYVKRGSGSGQRVRTYSDGERTWPVRESQLGGLLSSERPRRLN